jgi:hypothetical protein
MRVKSARPSRVYVIIRMSGLNALEDGARHKPQLRVYLDPYARHQEGVLSIVQQQYSVKATR